MLFRSLFCNSHAETHGTESYYDVVKNQTLLLFHYTVVLLNERNSTKYIKYNSLLINNYLYICINSITYRPLTTQQNIYEYVDGGVLLKFQAEILIVKENVIASLPVCRQAGSQ